MNSDNEHNLSNTSSIYQEVPAKDEAEIETSKLGNSLLQFAATISVCILTIGNGTVDSWTSPALPFLTSNNSAFPVSEFQGSWIASTSDLGSATGNLLTPIFSSFIGRKYSLLIFAIVEVISWAMIMSANNVITLYTARFISGVSCTLAISFTIMYVGEIAGKEIRGILLLIVRISTQLGGLFVKTVGAYLPYQMMNVAVISILIPFFLTFAFVPESPYYLSIKNRKEEAKRTIIKLKGTNDPEIVNSELMRINQTVKETKENEKWALWDLFSREGNRKSLLIVLIVCWTKFLSGDTSIEAYTQEIFNYSDFSIEPENAAILYAGVTVIMPLLVTKFVERAGRRKTFLFSGIFSTVGLGIVGLFFFVKFYIKADTASMSWIPFASLIFYNIASNLGISSLTYVITGEMFALNVKETAITCVTITNDMLAFLVKVVFQWMNNVAGIYTTFWMYAFFSLVGTTLFYWIAPETKGQTLEEIQNALHLKNRRGSTHCI
ncbi:facilitated trehalose transporter Tret1-like [Belonocnema kinseyi]|uniref:facilitated trehalose transporter Tret1-like n=1 Tax=Belonocnema kinseyi TaxID=2817044 RepID=UPI00143D633F|nr:facilitated trehalose transporter Tret1-like [Belonocnema kinseyi]